MAKNKPFPPAPFSHPALLGLGATLSLFLAGSLFFSPHFQTSDDVVLDWMTRGFGMVDKPSEFLLTINVAVGLVLKGLNLWTQAVPWYGLGLFGIFFLTTWAFLSAAFVRFQTGFRLFLILVLFLPVFFHCFAWPQYTVYCFLAAQAGIFLFLHPFQPRSLSFAGAGALLLLSSLLRLEPALYSMLMAVPFWLHLRNRPDGRRDNRAREWFLLGTLVLILAAAGFDRLYYRAHPPWREARDYYETRCSLMEYKIPDYGRQEKAFQSVGWSRNDYDAFTAGFYLSPLFDLDHLRKLDQKVSVNFRLKWDLLPLLFQYPIIYFLLFGLFAALLLGLREEPAFSAANTAWVLAGIFAVFALKKVVARVFWPQVFFAGMVLLFLGGAPRAGKAFPPGKKTLLPLALSALLCGLGLWSAHDDYAMNRPGPLAEKWVQESMDRLSPRPDQLYVIWGSSFPFVSYPVFQTTGLPRDFRFIWMWWLERTPDTERRLAQFGIKDFLRDTLDRPDVFWLFNPADKVYPHYLREHLNDKLSIRRVFQGYFDVFQISSGHPGKKS